MGPAEPRRDRGTAVVIGAGLSGLLAAQALAHHGGQVVVIDRDDLPAGDVPRTGIPHGRQAHVWQAPLRQLVADWFGLDPAGTSRMRLEWILRRQVAEVSTISFRCPVSALDVIVDGGAVRGVKVWNHRDAVAATIAADLVVDASGARSRITAWLVRHGFGAPPVTLTHLGLYTVTRWWRYDARPGGPSPLAWDADIVHPPDPRSGAPGVVAAPHHLGSWVLSVRSPTPVADTVADFTHQVTAVGDRRLTRLLASSTPVGTAVHHYLAALTRHHFEKQASWPPGLLPIGDAYATVHPDGPVRGGTLAAGQARVLATCLESPGPDLVRDYLTEVAALVPDSCGTRMTTGIDQGQHDLRHRGRDLR